MDFKPGDRVRRPDATIFDFAHGRTGTVHVEDDPYGPGKRWGVQWDGDARIFQYPPEQPMEASDAR